MSNSLAIATVTTALAHIVKSAAESVVTGADVVTGRPDPAGSPSHRIHLFLYQVSPNGALRNNDIPTRNAAGKPVVRPAAALDLHYLLAFYGNENELETQRMLGAVVRDLHSKPVLTRRMIKDAVASQAFLKGSNLNDAVEQVKFTPRKKPKKRTKSFEPFADTDGDKIPPMANFGEGYHTYATGLTHIEKGYPSTDKQHDHDRLVRRLVEKVRDNVDKLTDVEKDYIKGPKSDVAVVCYGVASRPVRHAVKQLRKKGMKIDMLRLRIVWPFPMKEIEALAKRTKRIVVPEMNLGQIVHPIEQAVKGRCPVKHVPKIGGVIHLPQEIIDAIKGGW